MTFETTQTHYNQIFIIKKSLLSHLHPTQSHMQHNEEYEELRNQVYDLRNQVNPLLGIKPEPNIFVKPSSWRVLDEDKIAKIVKRAPRLNKWSLYSTYRSGYNYGDVFNLLRFV